MFGGSPVFLTEQCGLALFLPPPHPSPILGPSQKFFEPPNILLYNLFCLHRLQECVLLAAQRSGWAQQGRKQINGRDLEGWQVPAGLGSTVPTQYIRSSWAPCFKPRKPKVGQPWSWLYKRFKFTLLCKLCTVLGKFLIL